jgi:hypothetical protein
VSYEAESLRLCQDTSRSNDLQCQTFRYAARFAFIQQNRALPGVGQYDRRRLLLSAASEGAILAGPVRATARVPDSGEWSTGRPDESHSAPRSGRERQTG